MSSALYSSGCVKGAFGLGLSSDERSLRARRKGLSFSSSFNPLRSLGSSSGASRRELPFGGARAASAASEFSRQDSYGRGRGRSLERPLSTSGSNNSSNNSLGLFVERTKNAIHWSNKRPRPRATVIEKKLKRSLTVERQRQSTTTPAPGKNMYQAKSLGTFAAPDLSFF